MASGYNPGSNVGNVAGFIADLISEGEGPTSGLQIFRDAGGAIRTQDWFQAYREVYGAIENSPLVASLDPFQVPDPTAYVPWTINGPESYVTQVQVLVRDKDSGVIGTSEFSYRTLEPHTPAEAEAAAFDEYSDPDNAGDYAQTILGTMTTNLYHTQAP